MWQRYNQGSHIFEKSLDNGASWVPMPINASSLEGTVPPGVLGGAIAYTDRINSFAHRQVIQPASGDTPTPYYALELQGGAATGGDHAGLIFHSWNMGADQKKWRIISNAGLLRFEPVSDAETATTGPNSYFDRSGSLNVGNALVVAGYIQNGSVIYPGRVDPGPAAQGSWYIGSHASYGIYLNTGIYVPGGLWVGGGANMASISCQNINTNGYNLTTGTLNVSSTITFPHNTWMNTAEGWQRLHFTWASYSYLKGNGIIFRNISDGEPFVFSSDGHLTSTGNIAAGGSIGCATNTWRSNFHTIGYVYPGDASGGAQVSWYIQGHGAYGLYCNTGFYVQGNVWSVAGFSSSTYYFSNYHNAYVGRWVGNCDNGNFPGTSGNGATNSGWLRVYDGVGNAIHIPYWY